MFLKSPAVIRLGKQKYFNYLPLLFCAKMFKIGDHKKNKNLIVKIMEKCKNSKQFEKYKKTLLEIIQEILPKCKVYLFGSRARCDHDEGADIDLALDNGKPIGHKTIYLIQEKIEETTIPLHVDLVDIQDAGEAIKKEIESEGILWKN